MRDPLRMWPGLALVSLIAATSYGLIRMTGIGSYGVSALTLAILIGAVLGNLKPAIAGGRCQPGLAFAQKRLLRAGVALYGFNLSVQQIAQVGSAGIAIDVAMVVLTLAVGWWFGRHVLGMDRETVLLASAGSAICGAAAVMATLPMLQARDPHAAEKGTVAVATVVLFGTLAMLLYPLIYAWLGAGHFDFGIFVGSTVHEVAQVVAIGSTIGGDVAGNAVIAKMIRVMLLVPFLLLLGLSLRRADGQGRSAPLPIPWFALVFVAMAGVNSLQILPPALVDALRLIGMLLLTAAMASLGIDTRLSRMRQAGPRPLILGAGLFVHLIVIGGLVNWLAA
ncbi:YeiH family protein [Propionivibrio dicarboxylicus]|uniref:Conserved hypothetical integral membrane protein n=1 Tax=Propionivibrio dicarboxylicus TaxID=83767 RepID=A0A1G8E925_9RHOO|nr:YeiH family protein [Propionivibrio dicarboxylicus]SDH66452.1 conserved hypothetical integral membrane protein [Propionivibrio dicarboxylicus]